MLKFERPPPANERTQSPFGGAELSTDGYRIGELFRKAVQKVTDFLTEQYLSITSDRGAADTGAAQHIVSRAAPYLGSTPNGTIFYTADLFAKASTIQDVLYAIPPARDVNDFEQRIKSHHQFIDDTIWKPLIGKSFLTAVREHFQREGIHCHSIDALNRESEFFVSAVTQGDISRFSSFLMWCLKDDQTIVDKLMSRLG